MSKDAFESIRPMRRVLRQGSVYSLATIAPLATGLVLTPLVTRVLGSQEYGLVALAISVTQIGHVVASLGLPAAVTRHVVVEVTGARGAAGQVLFGSMLSVAVVVVAVSGVFLTGILASDDRLRMVVLLALWSSFAVAVFTSVQAFTRGMGRAGTFVIQSVTISLLPPLFALILVAATGATASSFVTGVLAVQLVVTVIVLARVVREFHPRFSSAHLAHALRIGLPSVPHQLSTIGVSSLLVLLAGALHGRVAAGEMQLAILVGSVALLLIGAINNSWAVEVYRARGLDRRRAIEGSAWGIAVLATLLAWGAALLSPFVIRLLRAPSMDEHEMTAAAAVVVAAAPLMVAYLANVHPIFATGRTQWLALSTPVALVLSLAIALAADGLNEGGSLVGLASGVAPFYLFQAIFCTWLRRRTDCPKLALGPVWIISFVGVSGCVLISVFDPSSATRLALSLVVLALGFAGSLAVLGRPRILGLR